MEEIKLVQNPAAIDVDDIGDILVPFFSWDSTHTADGWYSKLPEKLWELTMYLHLEQFGYNTWDATKKLGITDDVLKGATYECPWTTNTYNWFYPMVLCCANIEFWLDRAESLGNCTSLGRDFVTDVEWARSTMRSCNEDHGSPIPLWGAPQAMLGHGYIEGTYPSDGHGRIHDATVLLSNGDFLAGKVWVWYNK